MKRIFLAALLLFFVDSHAAPPKREFYELRIYRVKTSAQENLVDQFLQAALIPSLHKAGIRHVGVFKPIESDTAERKIYVLIPISSPADLVKVREKIAADADYLAKGSAYLNAPYQTPPYLRMESILLQAFSHHPSLVVPALKGARSERVYELRSYESHTEKIFANKVHMFNEGGEVALFRKLGFNAVFYGEVVAGPTMPNLMYMTTFESKADRDAHWQTFRDDPEWKKMSSLPQYQNNVSKNTIFLLRPTEYSDY